MSPIETSPLDTFLRVIIGFGMSFVIVIAFIATAWYVHYLSFDFQ